MKIVVVGAFDGTHVGGSFLRAARALGFEASGVDIARAWNRGRIARSLLWHLADRRPLPLKRFSEAAIALCRETRPDALIATGAAPLTGAALRTLRALGVVTVNYSTDDPWNPRLRSRWHLRALPEYDVVFTTRRSNVADFERLGCKSVAYLPFAYDDGLFHPGLPRTAVAACDILFVGGGDADRVTFFKEFLKSGLRVTLVGGYWDRLRELRGITVGLMAPEQVAALTSEAKINLCLVRRANRDGSVMRSFEIAALGGCMLAEDTPEHRDIFGDDGECVVYFRGAAEAASRARALLGNPGERMRLKEALFTCIVAGKHTYRDRLVTMLNAAKSGAEGKERVCA